MLRFPARTQSRQTLCDTLFEQSCQNLIVKQMKGQANASAKSKEVQPTAPSQRIAPHLVLPQPHYISLNRFAYD